MNHIVNMRRSDKAEFIDGCITIFIDNLKIGGSRYNLIINPISKNTTNILRSRTKNAKITYSGSVTKINDNLLLMELDTTLKKDRLLEVMAHEMMHVKLIVSGMFSVVGKKHYWMGKEIKSSKMSYFNLPWEQHAWKNQCILANTILSVLSGI